MSAGKYRQIVTIQTPTDGLDEWGGDIVVWVDFATNVRAKKRPLRGRELVSAQATQSATDVMFYLRYFPGVESTMRIVCDGKNYDIDAVIDVDDRHRELEISATTGLSEG